MRECICAAGIAAKKLLNSPTRFSLDTPQAIYVITEFPLYLGLRRPGKARVIVGNATLKLLHQLIVISYNFICSGLVL